MESPVSVLGWSCCLAGGAGTPWVYCFVRATGLSSKHLIQCGAGREAGSLRGDEFRKLLGCGESWQRTFVIRFLIRPGKLPYSSFKISASCSTVHRHARINSWQPRFVPGLAFI